LLHCNNFEGLLDRRLERPRKSLDRLERHPTCSVMTLKLDSMQGSNGVAIATSVAVAPARHQDTAIRDRL
jgi:hypothetical protein